MWVAFNRVSAEKVRAAPYYVTYRMQTGAGRQEARSRAEVKALLAELRLAGASDITVIDAEGNLISFEPGD